MIATADAMNTIALPNDPNRSAVIRPPNTPPAWVGGPARATVAAINTATEAQLLKPPLLKGVRPEIGLGIGVIDIKDNEVESVDTVARRIERAAKVLGSDRIRYVHPDCGFWMLPRSASDAKMRALVAGRDRYLGTVSH